MIDTSYIPAGGKDHPSLVRQQIDIRKRPLLPGVRIVGEVHALERRRFRAGIPQLNPVLLFAQGIRKFTKGIHFADEHLSREP